MKNVGECSRMQKKIAETREPIEQEKRRISKLRQELFTLRHEVNKLEGYVSCLGEKALTMPEDLGEWNDAPARIQGLIQRIKQTHQLGTEVEQLSRSEQS